LKSKSSSCFSKSLKSQNVYPKFSSAYRSTVNFVKIHIFTDTVFPLIEAGV